MKTGCNVPGVLVQRMFVPADRVIALGIYCRYCILRCLILTELVFGGQDAQQSAAATRFIEKSLSTDARGYINHITLYEIVWVLQRCYGVTKQQVRDIIEGLLTTKQLNVENVEVTWKALRAFDAKNTDFCDALIGQVNIHSGCEYTVTFDKKAASLPGFDLLG